ncbi:MAG: alpha/beta hydrolase [Micrococcaceae bacterium]
MSETRASRKEIARKHLKKNRKNSIFKIAGIILLVLAVVAGMVFGISKLTQNPLASGAPAKTKSFYNQKLNWQSCENGMYCATMQAPVDWNNPKGDKVSIALIKTQATGQKQGSIVMNPGGPGSSGYDWVKDSAMSTISSKVTQSYDIVGFDPRGINKSDGIKCLDDKQHDTFRTNTANMDSDSGLAKLRTEYKSIADSCKKNSGPVLGHMDTASVARDMDLIRALIGEQKLNYLGFSYGTLLGATYANLYPEHVGHVVLDGAVDPALSYSEVTKIQASGFEQALKEYAQSCIKQKPCPLDPDGDGDAKAIVSSIQKMLNDNLSKPMKTSDGRTATSSILAQGIMVPLYNNLLWPTLSQAISEAMAGKPDRLVQFSDASAERGNDGKYTGNSDFSFMAVNCLDYSIPSDTKSIRADEAALEKVSPTFGRYMAGGGVICENWPYKTIRKIGPISTTSKSPLLVIGTSGDPATPFASAQNLTKELGNARLLKWKGQGHTAYGRSNDCVRDTVDNYFLSGNLPENNKTC